MKRLFLLLLLLPLYSLSAEEEAALGRNEDGRAYRTDESGFQVVDYLAELEMTVEEQKRQILALKNELAAANRPAPVAPLSEKNLLTGEVKQASISDNSAEIKGLKQEAGELRKILQQKDVKISELNSKLLALQSDASLATVELQNARASLLLAEKDKNKTVEVKSTELQAAEQKISAQSVEIQRLNSELSKFQSQIQAFDNGIGDREQEILTLRNKLSESEKLVSQQNAEISKLNQDLTKAVVPVTEKIAVPADIEPVRTPVQVAKVSVPADASRSKAFNILVENISRDISVAIKLDTERQSLFKTYKANPKSGSLAFNLTPAKTSDGVALGDLQGLLRDSDSFAELSKVQKALLYISKAVKSDVELLKRLVK